MIFIKKFLNKYNISLLNYLANSSTQNGYCAMFTKLDWCAKNLHRIHATDSFLRFQLSQ
jgi:hypothetical protein